MIPWGGLIEIRIRLVEEKSPYVTLVSDSMDGSNFGQILGHPWIPAAVTLLQFHQSLPFQAYFYDVPYGVGGARCGNYRLLLLGLSCWRQNMGKFR